MEWLSEHFTFEELTTTSHLDYLADNRADAELFKESLRRVANDLLEPVRGHYEKAVVVNSGYRGPALNILVGGSKTSQHCLGQAADFNVKGFESHTMQIIVIKWMVDYFTSNCYSWGQLLLERGCIHISLGSKCEVAEYNVPTHSKKPLAGLEQYYRG